MRLCGCFLSVLRIAIWRNNMKQAVKIKKSSNWLFYDLKALPEPEFQACLENLKNRIELKNQTQESENWSNEKQ
jgi:hypothetical protein